MAVIWSEQAKISYEKIIDNLLEQWSVDIVLNFEIFINKLLENIIINNNFCPASKIEQLRKCVVHKNVSLI